MGYLSLDKGPRVRTFSFSGKGRRYFIICIVNLLLTIITAGVYLPWALMRARRYVYSNMSLDGHAFIYKATGGSILLSLVIIFIIYHIGTFLIVNWFFIPGLIILALLFLSIPFMMVKSVQYQASMTSLNGVRFGFQCPMLSAWWYTFALPLLLIMLLCVVFYFLARFSASWDSGMLRLFMLIVCGTAGLGAIYGISYGKWITLFGNGIRYSTYCSTANITLMECIKKGVIAYLISAQFIIVVILLMGNVFHEVMVSRMLRNDDHIAVIYSQNYWRITLCYMLFFVAMIITSCYFRAMLRNQFLNNLTLADGAIALRSSATVTGIVLRELGLLLVSAITAGLAYPWLKMRYVRWLAEHTHVDGDLDALELKDDPTPPQSGPAMWISRGMMAYIPFL
ncbi:YjgN family protein [Klebsiella aerogenes]|uniref:YjgN family protein n=1 Tax=Klebsiella aerogenes TaxID=548 RepID=UPI000A3BDB9D|nr:DUF898 family protein [Klebsiella aerogenes]EKT8947731.1 DUF898 family protein [Klebsiella aerogenes]EKV8598631.1 DUF898 family protein [Klebsiella aerogenes]ELA0069641.1 DUF898 family protein [Klebsiella aerogenes]OUE92490.1 hypothetical protein AZZ82_002610 [Klebsiella aerogenes]